MARHFPGGPFVVSTAGSDAPMRIFCPGQQPLSFGFLNLYDLANTSAHNQGVTTWAQKITLWEPLATAG